MKDYGPALTAEIEAAFKPSGARNITGTQFCDQWKKFRSVAVSAQQILTFIFPAGAKILGVLIGIADAECGTGGSVSTARAATAKRRRK